MSEKQSGEIVELAEGQLSEVQGGLLVPAVQKIREAAARSPTADDESAITAVRNT